MEEVAFSRGLNFLVPPLRVNSCTVERFLEKGLCVARGLQRSFAGFFYKMKSGEILWDELCDHYYKGVEGVEEIQKVWNSLKGKIDEDEFNREESLLEMQHENAVSWRDGCVLYFQTFFRLPIPAGLPAPERDLEYYTAHNPK